MAYQDQVLRMLQIHNAKTERIRTGFKEKYDQRQAAKNDPGLNDDLDESSMMTTESVVDAPAAKKKKKTTSFVKKRKDVGIEIKVKGDDGEVTSYQEEEVEEKPKAAKKRSKIQSEETLEMLLNALKP